MYTRFGSNKYSCTESHLNGLLVLDVTLKNYWRGFTYKMLRWAIFYTEEDSIL